MALTVYETLLLKILAGLFCVPILSYALLKYIDHLRKIWDKSSQVKKWISLWALSLMILLMTGFFR